jgi:hypothetical protein
VANRLGKCILLVPSSRNRLSRRVKVSSRAIHIVLTPILFTVLLFRFKDFLAPRLILFIFPPITHQTTPLILTLGVQQVALLYLLPDTASRLSQTLHNRFQQGIRHVALPPRAV